MRDPQKPCAWLLSEGPPEVRWVFRLSGPYQEGLGLAGRPDWRSPRDKQRGKLCGRLTQVQASVKEQQLPSRAGGQQGQYECKM